MNFQCTRRKFDNNRVTLEFYPLRFSMVARERVRFPVGKAANTLRGALGASFRKLACRPECESARRCQFRVECDYARFFEPFAAGEGPSGLSDWPRPFVLRAWHLDGQSFERNATFDFSLHLFAVRDPAVPRLVEAIAAMARAGFGPAQGRAEMASVTGMAIQTLSLLPRREASRVAVRFLTPTELKSGGGLASTPEFPVLFARIRDRLSILRALYGDGPLEIDFAAEAERARDIRLVRCDTERVRLERRSSRTGLTHSLGGFTGEAEYEGDLTGFLPYLEAAQWTGVGRQTVWGKGQIEVRCLN